MAVEDRRDGIEGVRAEAVEAVEVGEPEGVQPTAGDVLGGERTVQLD